MKSGAPYRTKLGTTGRKLQTFPNSPCRSCLQPSLLRRSAGRSYSLLFFPAPFIFQFLHRRQPARRFFGRPRL